MTEEEEALEMINYINNLSEDEFDNILNEVDNEYFKGGDNNGNK